MTLECLCGEYSYHPQFQEAQVSPGIRKPPYHTLYVCSAEYAQVSGHVDFLEHRSISSALQVRRNAIVV